MTLKNIFFKIVIIWSIFVISSLSVWFIFSLNNEKLSDFWIVGNVWSVFARDDEEEDEFEFEKIEDEEDYKKFEKEFREIEDIFEKKEFIEEKTKNDIILPEKSNANTVSIPTSTSNLSNSKLSNTLKQNFTKDNNVTNQVKVKEYKKKVDITNDGCIINYDTVTNASGTKMQIHNKTCDKNFILSNDEKKILSDNFVSLINDIEKIDKNDLFKLSVLEKLDDKLDKKVKLLWDVNKQLSNIQQKNKNFKKIWFFSQIRMDLFSKQDFISKKINFQIITNNQKKSSIIQNAVTPKIQTKPTTTQNNTNTKVIQTPTTTTTSKITSTTSVTPKTTTSTQQNQINTRTRAS